MTRTKLFNRNLNRIITEFQEVDNNSPNFINVTFVQDTYTSGKNVFKIKPNYKNIQKDSIDYEILDVNGNTIYHTKLQYIDDDGSDVIAIHVYEDTPIGNATIYFVGTVNVNLNGDQLLPFQNKPNNYRYIHRLHIDNSKRNDSDIIFVTEPRFVVSEKKARIVEEKFTNNKLTTIYGTGSYLVINDTATILDGDRLFKSEMEMGTLSFPVLSENYFPKQKYEIPNFAYSSRITSVVSPVQLVLETPLYVSSSVGSSATLKKGVTKIQSQPYSIQYYQNPTERNTTQNEKPYAKIDIENMEAGTGHVSRVKVFTKSAVKPQSEYQLVYDSELDPKNILVDDTTSLIEYPIGIFNGNTNVVSGPSFYSSSLNATNYWNVVRLSGAPSASKSTNSSYLSNAIALLPSMKMSGSQELMLEQTGSVRTPFWKDTSYVLKFDYYLTKNVLDTRDSKLDVYISGSSFGTNNELGYFLGSVPTHKGSLSIVRDYTIPIRPNSDGDGILRFVMRDGAKIANIRVQENVERGFSSNRTKLYVPIKNEHKNEYLDFKIQFFNYTLKEANREFLVKSSFFEGGNQYIVGDNNIITGSTFVAPYSSSGIELYGNIAGAKSGSYISSYGYKGIEWAKLYPITASNYGWSLTQGNPYFSASYSNGTVQMINKSGSLFEFRSNPDSFNFNAVGSNSSVLIGISGSAPNSYFQWDGTNLVVYVSGSKLTTATGSFTGSFTGSGLFDYIDFNTGSAVPVWKSGRVFWDDTWGALGVYNAEQDITLQVGQENYVKVANNTGTLISNGAPVKVTGATGNYASITLAQSTIQSVATTTNDIIGVATHDIEHGSVGFVTTFGMVNGINTNAYNEGDLLWVSTSIGQLTATVPSAPYDKTFVGVVVKKSGNGSIFVSPNQPIHFHDLSSVSSSAYSQGDLFTYNASGGIWTNTKQLSGSYTTTGNVTFTPPSTGTNTAIYVSGSNTVGGSTYIDFLRVSNNTSPVTNPHKYFRLNSAGTLEVVDSVYGSVIWSLTDTGLVQIPSAASKTLQLKATGSAINFGTSGGQIFDDGNFHIHSLNPNANLWMNASGSGKLIINAQSGATGGVLMGTETQSGYVTISGSVNATYTYAYLANLNPSTPVGYSSGTNPYSLTANQRIQAAEFDATSDERLKNIIGKIKLSDAIRLIKNVEPIQFTWKDEIDKGTKTGFSAQKLIKTGFEHMVGGVPRVGLEETVDNDGFISPKDTQLVVNTDQITAYHSLLIKHLLERIEELEKKLLVSNN